MNDKPAEVLPSAAVSLDMIESYIAKHQSIREDSDLAKWFRSVRSVLNRKHDDFGRTIK